MFKISIIAAEDDSQASNSFRMDSISPYVLKLVMFVTLPVGNGSRRRIAWGCNGEMGRVVKGKG